MSGGTLAVFRSSLGYSFGVYVLHTLAAAALGARLVARLLSEGAMALATAPSRHHSDAALLLQSLSHALGPETAAQAAATAAAYALLSSYASLLWLDAMAHPRAGFGWHAWHAIKRYPAALALALAVLAAAGLLALPALLALLALPRASSAGQEAWLWALSGANLLLCYAAARVASDAGRAALMRGFSARATARSALQALRPRVAGVWLACVATALVLLALGELAGRALEAAPLAMLVLPLQQLAMLGRTLLRGYWLARVTRVLDRDRPPAPARARSG